MFHGSVKRQVGAAYFNRIAKERGLPVIAVSRGITVDKEIPASIREGLATPTTRRFRLHSQTSRQC